jgi:hypothetical protein
VLAFHGQHAFALGTLIALAERSRACRWSAKPDLGEVAFLAGGDGGRKQPELPAQRIGRLRQPAIAEAIAISLQKGPQP